MYKQACVYYLYYGGVFLLFRDLCVSHDLTHFVKFTALISPSFYSNVSPSVGSFSKVANADYICILLTSTFTHRLVSNIFSFYDEKSRPTGVYENVKLFQVIVFGVGADWEVIFRVRCCYLRAYVGLFRSVSRQVSSSKITSGNILRKTMITGHSQSIIENTSKPPYKSQNKHITKCVTFFFTTTKKQQKRLPF